jgi:alkaline phosphatase D
MVPVVARGGPFLHGVASGDPLSDQVVIWTRLTTSGTGPVEVAWRVAEDPDLEVEVAAGSEIAGPEHDHTVKVDVADLEPAGTYYYGFEALGQRSPTGRTKTLPSPCEHVRFGVCSCAKYTAGYFNAYARLADRNDLDFVLHLGDYIYEYPTDDGKALGPQIGREMEPPHECRNLGDYRRRYGHYRLDLDVQRVHAMHPFINTLDDHEICNDTWKGGAGKHDDAEDGPWEARKAAALQAWHEWIPIREPDPANPHLIYRDVDIGGLVHLIVLDGRTHRDEQVSGQRLKDPNRSVLGRTQYEWFVGRLSESTQTWRVVANAVMIGQVYTGLDPEEVGTKLSELGILTSRDLGPEPDQWDGYPAERDRLFRFIEDHPIHNIVFLSGDVHSAWAVELKRDPAADDERPLGVEFVTTSLTSENLDEELRVEPRTRSVEIENKVVEDNPHIKWVELDSHGYMVCDITKERVHNDWYFVETLRRRTAKERKGASWAVRLDDHQLREA